MTKSQRVDEPTEVRFRGSLPYRLTGVLALLADASRFEGFDQRVYVLYASLSQELRRDIDLVFGPLGKHVIFRHLWRDAPEIGDLTSFISWVSQIDSDAMCGAISATLHRFAAEEAFRTGTNVVGPAAYDETHLRRFLQDLDYPWKETARSAPAQFDRMIRLLLEPEELKASLVLTLTQFWGGYYQKSYEECTPIVERSLRYHEARQLTGDAGSILRDVTGRELPDAIRADLASVRSLVLVPSCHAGLFVSPIALDRTFETILIQYNCRTSGVGEEALATTAREVFPMLRALSDETRLLIVQMLKEGELYSQQIVDRLDLSQSSVSRHLSLLVTGGILSSRWEGGMKYYRINDHAIDRLAARLTELKREGEGGETLR